ncbi:MAG: hypothetical protein V2I51_09630, partial [Anderseniella sp.]|nr:hypothetical protein [Anderseniella sp.]
TLRDAALRVLEKRDEWLRVEPSIEEIRISTKASIMQCSTHMECERALSTARKALDALSP